MKSNMRQVSFIVKSGEISYEEFKVLVFWMPVSAWADSPGLGGLG